ncbi:hypothetical protein CDAR_536881 [Caerostris darwini]|uniref:Uncharacterized protein n=1 Tax=Caerostris darwini TaxID=1538125 RepID=A0AAV4NUX9_9ARAC|nr:hypothetical protein CDAR_536881 [Caerostris darwini]
MPHCFTEENRFRSLPGRMPSFQFLSDFCTILSKAHGNMGPVRVYFTDELCLFSSYENIIGNERFYLFPSFSRLLDKNRIKPKFPVTSADLNILTEI